jgi:hypothetical protein
MDIVTALLALSTPEQTLLFLFIACWLSNLLPNVELDVSNFLFSSR